ncbi:MAG: hypothetical protein CR991_04650 [Proteobacteria bacterium]|nr:MAG: hypothetical protein CR991_04650 [Pseudomonadota bacterium]
MSVFFRLATDRKSAEERGVISANEVTPKEVSDEILMAIKNNPGLKTGADFDSLLEITEKCQLFRVTIKLSDQPDIQHTVPIHYTYYISRSKYMKAMLMFLLLISHPMEMTRALNGTTRMVNMIINQVLVLT